VERSNTTPVGNERLSTHPTKPGDFALIALPFETPGLLVEPLFDEDLWVMGASDDPATSLTTLA